MPLVVVCDRKMPFAGVTDTTATCPEVSPFGHTAGRLLAMFNPDYFHVYLPLQVQEQAPCVVEMVTTWGERYAIRGVDTILNGAVLLDVYPRDNCRHSRDVMTEKLTLPYASISAVRVVKNATVEAEVIRVVRPAAPD